MTNTIEIGKRIIPLEQIALIEPYVPNEQSRMKSTRPFQTRIVLLNRDSVLTEDALDGLAEAHGFRMLPADRVAANPTIRFSVERFEGSEGFTPTKPYRSRLLWRDLDGQPNSKLLVTSPDDVLARVIRGEGIDERPLSEPKPIRRTRNRSAAAAPR